MDYKKSDNVHRVEKAQGGEYKFCFDNTISHFNSKTVFFELIIEDPSNPQDENDAIFSDMEGLSPEEFYEMKVQDINDIIQSVKNRMGKARQLQDMLRSFEARDRNLAEMNNSRVNLFSVFIIVTMVCVGIIQVFMIRSLFETDPKQKRVWEKISKLIESFQWEFQVDVGIILPLSLKIISKKSNSYQRSSYAQYIFSFIESHVWETRKNEAKEKNLRKIK